jgi:pyruvate dehydrogenase phosphatase
VSFKFLDYTNVIQHPPSKGWMEDFVALKSVSVSGVTKDALSTNWSLVSLTNGFGGSSMSLELSKMINDAVLGGLISNLHEYVKPNSETEFTDIETSPYPTEPYEEAVNRVIKGYFVAIDTALTEDFLKEAFSSGKKTPAIRSQSVALSGCSALLSLYDSSTKELRIALTGDSRAILGRPLKNKDGCKSYEVHVLTADQTILPSAPHASVISQAKLPHPVSRAFGVASLKWGREIQQRLHEEYLGDRPFLPTTTTTEPPYITAEPEITSISIKPGDFLVLGSAGLWKSLTNEEIVGLLGVWVDRGMINADTNVVGRLSSPEVLNPRDLPVAGRSAKVVQGDSDDGTTMYRRWRTKKQFVCVDHNAALHLARNALGGANQDLTAALLSMSPPRAAWFRWVNW